MNLFKKVRKFLSLDSKMKLLYFEAFLFLGWARILIYLPFSKVSPTLGCHMVESSFSKMGMDQDILGKISSTINVMSNHTFWDSKCLVKAIAAMKMLERRHIESTLYLGTTKDEQGKLIAHAWLRSGPVYISGFEEMKRFIVVGKFAKIIK
jgi:hypothetical protein